VCFYRASANNRAGLVEAQGDGAKPVRGCRVPAPGPAMPNAMRPALEASMPRGSSASVVESSARAGTGLTRDAGPSYTEVSPAPSAMAELSNP